MNVEPAPMPDGAITIGPEKSGSVVTVAPNTPVTIRLPENASTGFRWEMAPIAGLSASISERAGAGGGAPGASRAHDFVITPLAPGVATILLVLRRPWEPEDKVAQRFTVTVVAR